VARVNPVYNICPSPCLAPSFYAKMELMTHKSRTLEKVASAPRASSRFRRQRGSSRHNSAAVANIGHRRWEASPAATGELDCVSDVLARERTYRRYLALADGLAALLSALTAAVITGTHLTWLVAAAPALVVLGAKIQGLYDRDDLVIRKSTWSELPRLLNLTAVMTLIGYAEPPGQLRDPSRRQDRQHHTDGARSDYGLLTALQAGASPSTQSRPGPASESRRVLRVDWRRSATFASAASDIWVNRR